MDMYFYPSSKDSLDIYPNNKPWDFIVDLPEPIYLEGKWGCGLMDMTFDDWLYCTGVLAVSCVVRNYLS